MIAALLESLQVSPERKLIKGNFFRDLGFYITFIAIFLIGSGCHSEVGCMVFLRYRDRIG
ncbi:hypothetical protein AL516_18240 [Klebsiella pneumoniae]|nr:hypothetical protein AL516_18240 [Klebsiella pneumoniae]